MTTLVPLVILLSVPAAAPEPTSFKVDPGHSSVVFRVLHLNLSPFWGRFNKVAGTIALDDANLAKAAIRVTVDAASVDSNSADRDAHLKGQDFFNAKQFPQISFFSTKVVRAGEDRYTVTGELTMIGKTREVTFPVERTGARDLGGRFGYRVGYEAILTVKRSDFGMNYGIEREMLGDEVRLVIALEGIASK